MTSGKLLRGVGIGIAVLAILAVVGGFVTRWRLDKPTVAEQTLARVTAERPRVDDADNGFIFLWGFDAPEGDDPAEAGARRLAWLAEFNRDPSRAPPDPLEHGLDFKGHSAAELDPVLEVCKDDKPTECRNAFEAIDVLPRRGWFGTVGHEVSSPLPPLEAAITAQRLYYVRAHVLSRTLHAVSLRDQLERDLRFWRTTQQCADDLIVKMIAIVAIRQHFFFSNLILRRLPPELARDATPAGWTHEMSAEERSMWRVMAGEFEFSKSAVRQAEREAAAATALDDDGDYEFSVGDRLLRKIGLSLYPPRMQLRRLAQLHVDLAQAYVVPLHRYVAAAQPLQKKYALIFGDRYSYALRVGAVEGWRRAALSAAQLRAAAVAPADVPARLRESPLRDPFTLEALGWDPQAQAIVFTSPATNRRFRRVLFFY